MSINEEAAKNLVARLQKDERKPGSDNDIIIRSIERMLVLEEENRRLRMQVERHDIKNSRGGEHRSSIF